MLELKKITKIYNTDSFKQTALDEFSIKFRKNEFVSILGPSGSGKTTLLNIIGGLDHYTTGDLIINGVSTKKYTVVPRRSLRQASSSQAHFGQSFCWVANICPITSGNSARLRNWKGSPHYTAILRRS